MTKYSVKPMSNIAQVGLDKLDDTACILDESTASPDGILVRSTKLSKEDISDVAIGSVEGQVGACLQDALIHSLVRTELHDKPTGRDLFVKSRRDSTVQCNHAHEKLRLFKRPPVRTAFHNWRPEINTVSVVRRNGITVRKSLAYQLIFRL